MGCCSSPAEADARSHADPLPGERWQSSPVPQRAAGSPGERWFPWHRGWKPPPHAGPHVDHHPTVPGTFIIYYYFLSVVASGRWSLSSLRVGVCLAWLSDVPITQETLHGSRRTITRARLASSAALFISVLGLPSLCGADDHQRHRWSTRRSQKENNTKSIQMIDDETHIKSKTHCGKKASTFSYRNEITSPRSQRWKQTAPPCSVCPRSGVLTPVTSLDRILSVPGSRKLQAHIDSSHPTLIHYSAKSYNTSNILTQYQLESPNTYSERCRDTDPG